ncbi:hypothetical protein PAPYR_12265 [Paratrimastix pyriformis]|uniref:Uncharacterized protein n=1 Tax=Paratrimastix pyriformis TaxID=342808 RepID=A0ABQ8U7J1_9EUKA|nr:hypothetical protein PAPYR_12265 [Paratrimastix pyriformis]
MKNEKRPQSVAEEVPVKRSRPAEEEKIISSWEAVNIDISEKCIEILAGERIRPDKVSRIDRLFELVPTIPVGDRPSLMDLFPNLIPSRSLNANSSSPVTVAPHVALTPDDLRGTFFPCFREGADLLPLLERTPLVPAFVHPVEISTSLTFHHDEEAPHLHQIGLVITPPVVALYHFVLRQLATDPGRIVCVGGPPFAGKSQALKLLAAALRLKVPDKEVFYYRFPGDFQHRLSDFPARCIVIIDQVLNFSSFTDATRGNFLLVLASSAGLTYPNRGASDQTPIASFSFPFDVGRQAFDLYVNAAKAIPIVNDPAADAATSTSSPAPFVPQTEDDVGRLYEFLGGSLLAAMCLMSRRRFPALLTAPPALEGVPAAPEISRYPPAARFIAALVGPMKDALESTRRAGYFFDAAAMISSDEDELCFRKDPKQDKPQTDLRWFVPPTETGAPPPMSLRIASPLYRYALSLASRAAQLGPEHHIPAWISSNPVMRCFYHEHQFLGSIMRYLPQLRSVISNIPSKVPIRRIFLPASLERLGEHLDTLLARSCRPCLLCFLPPSFQHAHVDLIRVLLLRDEGFIIADQVTDQEPGFHRASLEWYQGPEFTAFSRALAGMYPRPAPSSAVAATSPAPIRNLFVFLTAAPPPKFITLTDEALLARLRAVGVAVYGGCQAQLMQPVEQLLERILLLPPESLGGSSMSCHHRLVKPVSHDEFHATILPESHLCTTTRTECADLERNGFGQDVRPIIWQ